MFQVTNCSIIQLLHHGSVFRQSDGPRGNLRGLLAGMGRGRFLQDLLRNKSRIKRWQTQKLYFLFRQLQGDTSGCLKPPVDTDLTVAHIVVVGIFAGVDNNDKLNDMLSVHAKIPIIKSYNKISATDLRSSQTHRVCISTISVSNIFLY